MEMTREERAYRAMRADALINDPLLQEGFAGAEAEFIAKWKDGPSVEIREEAWALVQALETVQHKLRAIMADGRYAQAALDRMKE